MPFLNYIGIEIKFTWYISFLSIERRLFSSGIFYEKMDITEATRLIRRRNLIPDINVKLSNYKPTRQGIRDLGFADCVIECKKNPFRRHMLFSTYEA